MNTWPGAFDPDPGYRGDAPGLKPKIPVGAMNLIVTDPPPLQPILMHHGRGGIPSNLKLFFKYFLSADDVSVQINTRKKSGKQQYAEGGN